MNCSTHSLGIWRLCFCRSYSFFMKQIKISPLFESGMWAIRRRLQPTGALTTGPHTYSKCLEHTLRLFPFSHVLLTPTRQMIYHPVTDGSIMFSTCKTSFKLFATLLKIFTGKHDLAKLT